MSAQIPETYLELCNRLAQEAGVPGDPMTAVVQLLSNEPKRICDWVNDSLMDVLGDKLWSFMWEQTTVTLPLNVNVVAGTVEASRYDKESMYYIPTGSNGPREIDYMEWRDFERAYRILNSPGSITAWAIRPDKSFAFNAKSTDAGGTVFTFQRWKNPTPMVSETDQPPIPNDLRMVIVWNALKKYAGYDEAGTQRSIAIDEYRDVMNRLMERCLPSFTFGGSLLDNYSA